VGSWKSVLELDHKLSVTSGSAEALQSAVRKGADLRIYTEFRHHEHLEPGSDNHEIVQEVSDFRVTYLVDRRWVAGIMNLRMPISPPVGFGTRASMSFFMYNQNGRQAIARPFLDGQPGDGQIGPSPLDDHRDMPKYLQHDAWDAGTNAPSSNFTYLFERFRYFVRDEWREVYSNDADGIVTGGALDELAKAFVNGSEVKVGISSLCAELGSELDHELFVQTGPGYYATERRIFAAGSQPIVRVKPAIPMSYESRGWDFGWLMVRTDGFVARWLCDPYTLKFQKSDGRYAIRWFVR
jgi:hypothetical protein